MSSLDVPAARSQFDAALRDAGTPERAVQEKRYLKSDVQHYGATMPVINRVTRAFSCAHPEMTREDMSALVESLWAPGIHELRVAAEVVGPLADRAPDGARASLDRWAADADLWMRRTVLLRFLLPVRRGERAAFEAFTGYADRMLEEREFLVRKAIGWVLREYGKRDPEEVAAWLEPRLVRAAGLTVREACKHLPEATREALLAGRRDGVR